ncbi:hypothetical protein Pst134EA_017123 [Puccinia striiformis f. sp. tritici]|uniref:hypothetical protein n=1 Tax=Puccinia striiformis f. sp. tritici TaxID=168172 RepID=UPI002007913A|nr:hypothetical protein Pst134EA_017123 [Puccinia striiformis f. sp. tritici]KAH9460807.1 hypothetical protein Pst134EA_017123 [Puccinia striiformis f. sp. tritici]
MIDISKPAWLEYVQKTNFDNYIKGYITHPLLDFLGQSIFVVDGELWKRARHATSTIFTVKTFKTIIEPCASRSMEGLTDELRSAAGEEHSIDVCDLFFRFTLNSVAQMTFGKDLDLLGAKYSAETDSPASSKLAHSVNEFVDAFDFAQEQSNFRLTLIVGWKLIESMNSSMGKRMKHSIRIIDNFVYSLLDERIASLSRPDRLKEAEHVPKDLLGLFMDARDERGGGLSRTELRDTAVGLIFGARDSTAQTMSWALFHLLMNKDLVTRVREEAAKVLGDQQGDRSKVTYANHKQFVVAHAIILETLRLHPSAPKVTCYSMSLEVLNAELLSICQRYQYSRLPQSAKIALADDKIPDGPTIHAGDVLRWSDWQIGRDVTVWGPDCGEFKPDRWFDETGRIKQFGQFKFHAFNGGPRLCLGMSLAKFEAIKIMVEVLQNFDLEFADGWLENVPKTEAIEGVPSRYPVPAYKSSVTFPMRHPMMVIVKPHAN